MKCYSKCVIQSEKELTCCLKNKTKTNGNDGVSNIICKNALEINICVKYRTLCIVTENKGELVEEYNFIGKNKYIRNKGRKNKY